MTSGPRPVRAHRGTQLHTLGWPQEAALRMLQNNLDPEVAEHPDELVVYGGTGKAARDWASFDALVRTLETLKGDETMLVQSGRPVGVMQTHEWAPRVLLANSNLVGDWANWDEFRRLEKLGLTMYGQMTAGSWIYIGTQGILQGTYETFSAVAAQKFGGTLAGTITLTGGLGGMGGAQPLAVTMNDGVAICVDVDPSRIARRIEHGYLDVEASSLDDALERAYAARDAKKPLSIGLLGNAAIVFPELLAHGRRDRHRHRPDQRARPARLPAARVLVRRVGRRPQGRPHGLRGCRPPLDGASRSRRWSGSRRPASEVFDYGNNIRTEALAAGYADAFALPRLRARVHPPAVQRGQGPVPLGGAQRRPEGHRRDRPCRARAVPRERVARALDPDGRRARALPGAARTHLLARLRRARRRRPALQRHGRVGRDQRAARHRPRPPRLGLGRVARTARPRR